MQKRHSLKATDMEVSIMKKRIVSMILCLALMMTLTVPAFADAQSGRVVSEGDRGRVFSLTGFFSMMT